MAAPGKPLEVTASGSRVWAAVIVVAIVLILISVAVFAVVTAYFLTRQPDLAPVQSTTTSTTGASSTTRITSTTVTVTVAIGQEIDVTESTLPPTTTTTVSYPCGGMNQRVCPNGKCKPGFRDLGSGRCSPSGNNAGPNPFLDKWT
jgi:hypothetical protein